MAYSLATTSISNPVSEAGLRLDSHKGPSTLRPIRSARVPDELIIALDQHIGASASPVVRVGERVRRGQPIAKPTATISAWLHAPVSGVVRAIEPRPVPHNIDPGSPCIVIANDGLDELFDVTRFADYQALDPGALCEHIAFGGIVGLGGAVFPTANKLTRQNKDQRIELILNGVECEPFITCDDMLMRERASLVIAGAQIMLHALSANLCVIAIEDDKPEAESALRAALSNVADERLHLAVLASEYPAGGERQLITAVAQVEVPSGGLPQDIGYVCQNVGTAAAVAKWVLHGEPLISRIITFAGAGVAEPGNLDVRIGTTIASLVEESGGYTSRAQRLISGGSMMGVALPRDDMPVVKGTNCLLISDDVQLQPRAPEMPCIRCGECAEACPVTLLPQQLHWHACAEDAPALAALGLLDCIECGCCDYVCPSQIPLAHRFRMAKPPLIEHLDSAERSARYRQRFDSRKERLDALEADRRARLQARRRVATRNQPGSGE